MQARGGRGLAPGNVLQRLAKLQQEGCAPVGMGAPAGRGLAQLPLSSDGGHALLLLLLRKEGRKFAVVWWGRRPGRGS